MVRPGPQRFDVIFAESMYGEGVLARHAGVAAIMYEAIGLPSLNPDSILGVGKIKGAIQ